MGDEWVCGDSYQSRRVRVQVAGDRMWRVGATEESKEPTGTAQGAVSAFGVCLALRYGFVPSPFTLWDSVFDAAARERLLLRGGSLISVFDPTDLPEAPPAAGDAEGAERAYLAAVRSAIESCIRRLRPERLIFMQSAGKDSSVLARVLAALNASSPAIEIQPVTYEAGIRESESEAVIAINARLGLPSPFVVYQDPRREMEFARDLTRRPNGVVGDLALMAYVACLKGVGAGPGDLVIDGLGADLHMGVTVSWRQRCLLAAPRRLRALMPLAPRAERFSVAYALDRLDRAPVEQIVPGTHLTMAQLAEIFPEELLKGVVSVAEAFDHQVRGADDVHQWRTWILRLQESNAAMEKARLAAELVGCSLLFPLASEEATKVVVGLPPSLRSSGGLRPVTKPLFHHMLSGQAEDRYTSRGKGSFRWNVQRFVRENRDTIRGDLDRAEGVVPGVRRLLGSLAAYRCPEVESRKIYLLWLHTRWWSEMVGRGAAVSWRLPRVKVVSPQEE